MVPIETLQKLEEIASEIAAREGCRLYDLEFNGGSGGRTLRLYVDKELEGGASIEDCSNISKAMNLRLDVEDLIPGGQYNLEVSTPGIERHLKKPWHFQGAVGKKIRVRLNRNLESFGIKSKGLLSKKQLSEVLKASTDDSIQFELENELVVIPFSAVEKANVVFDFTAAKGKKIKHNKE